MSVFEIVGIWSMVAGLLVGIAMHLNMSADIHTRVERLCLRFGGFGAFGLVVPMVNNSDKPVMSPALITLGLIVGIPLVIGVVLSIGGKWRSGV